MPKKAKELSALEVRNLSEPGTHFVGGVAGLALKVKDTGAKSWVLRAMVPDGHPKLLHCWPVKLLQAGRGDYAGSEVMIRRAAASLSL